MAGLCTELRWEKIVTLSVSVDSVSTRVLSLLCHAQFDFRLGEQITLINIDTVRTDTYLISLIDIIRSASSGEFSLAKSGNWPNP
jgi:hypothetical protein